MLYMIKLFDCYPKKKRTNNKIKTSKRGKLYRLGSVFYQNANFSYADFHAIDIYLKYNGSVCACVRVHCITRDLDF